MDKESSAIYFEFFKSFRVALTNTSVYFNGHPLYAKAVDGCKKNLDKILLQLNPFIIGITGHTLVLADEYLEDQELIKNIAEFSES